MKTIEEINERIRRRRAVVLTAPELLRLVREEGVSRSAKRVDVVTSGTFGAMCSSGAFLNFGHTKPRIRASRVWLNGVEAYAGVAAVDCYIGATRRKRRRPGERPYGGGHLIHDLVAGKAVNLKVTGRSSDCYPGRWMEKQITLAEMTDAFLFCPRNACQNYVCAVNSGSRTLHTYMGVLKPRLGNATFSGAGSLSPLMKDPYLRTVGIGTTIFLGGGVGYVTGPGTQHNASVPRTDLGIPRRPAGTLAVTGDLKQMHPRWLKGTSFRGYGPTLRVGLGIPIPILDESMLLSASCGDEDILVPVVDFEMDYPQSTGRILAEISYAELKTGRIRLFEKDIPAFCLSDSRAALAISRSLQQWIRDGFCLTKPVAPLVQLKKALEAPRPQFETA